MTHPFDSILLVTLGTPFDLGAERVAVAVAQSRKRPLMAIVPLGAPEFEAQALESVAKAEEEANARLAVLAEEARKVGIEFDAHVRRGEEPWREILDEARERKADLIVCRRYGRLGFLASLLVGEMVMNVASHAACNVLMVPRSSQMWRRRILLATDGAPDSERAAAVASEVALGCRIPMTIVSVSTEGIDAGRHAEAAAGIARSAGVEVDVRVVSGPSKPSDAIVAVARETRADLVVVGRRGREGKDVPRLGRNAERIIGTVECPVLIVAR